MDKSPARHATGGRIRSESHRITDTDPRGPPPRSTATTLTDQELVEAFPSQCPDEAFRDRVRPGCPDRSTDDPDVGTGEDRVERGGELAIPVADQEPEKRKNLGG